MRGFFLELLDAPLTRNLPGRIRLRINQMAISFTEFSSGLPQGMLLGVVHNHAGRDTVALKHHRQILASLTLLLHGMAPIPAKSGAKGLAIDVTTGGFCPSLKSVTKNRMWHTFVA